MRKSGYMLSNEKMLRLLQEGKYEQILSESQDFINRNVETYLKNFQHYHQFSQDFLQDVYIHLLTRTLPSPAFLKACQETNTFRFYFAKSIRNALNTLLKKEKIKKQNLLEIDSFHSSQEEESSLDRSLHFEDKSLREQTDSQDLLNQLNTKLKNLLNDFLKTLPKIAFKLILMLKLMARAKIYEKDVRNCFQHISRADTQKFLDELGSDETYRQLEDIEIYEMVYPYFQTYRNENGTPDALQRWVNQHISGGKNQEGILKRLTIQDRDTIFKIQDKKVFSDFLHLYFKNNEMAQEAEDKEENLSTVFQLQNHPLPVGKNSVTVQKI